MGEVSAVFDASNLRQGGAVQVASSVFSELLGDAHEARHPWLAEAAFVASPEVAASLSRAVAADCRVRVFASGRWGRRPQLALARDAVWFDVFGGAVQRRVPVPRLAGFADVTAIYPHPTAAGWSRSKIRLRGWLSRTSFTRADRVVVETTAVRDRLALFGFDASSIDVVPNGYHPVFDQPVERVAVSLWDERLSSICGDRRRVLYVARAYPHKNHDFIGRVAGAMKAENWGVPAFVLTLTDEEFAGLSRETRAVAINVGPLNVRELPALYRAVDACFFPSLLECFSVTPLEGLRSGVPVVAIDRDYCTSTVGDRVLYFASADAVGAARRIQEALEEASELPLEDWEAWARSQDGSSRRASRYVSIMEAMRRTPFDV